MASALPRVPLHDVKHKRKEKILGTLSKLADRDTQRAASEELNDIALVNLRTLIYYAWYPLGTNGQLCQLETAKDLSWKRRMYLQKKFFLTFVWLLNNISWVLLQASAVALNGREMLLFEDIFWWNCKSQLIGLSHVNVNKSFSYNLITGSGCRRGLNPYQLSDNYWFRPEGLCSEGKCHFPQYPQATY